VSLGSHDSFSTTITNACLCAGLDIAPSEIPHDYLDYDISNRLSYVQHNFLDPLPFNDDRFDFVRVANVGLGVPGESTRRFSHRSKLT
jgi:hypothetical protein